MEGTMEGSFLKAVHSLDDDRAASWRPSRDWVELDTREDHWLMSKRMGREEWTIGLNWHPIALWRKKRSIQITWQLGTGKMRVKLCRNGIGDTWEDHLEPVDLDPCNSHLDLMVMEELLEKVSRGEWRSWRERDL